MLNTIVYAEKHVATHAEVSSSVLLSSPELSDTKVYAPSIRARLGTTAHFCKVVVLKFSEVQLPQGGHRGFRCLNI